MNLSNLIDKMIQEEPMTVDSVGSIPQSGDEMWSGSSTEGATAGLRKLKKGKKKYTNFKDYITSVMEDSSTSISVSPKDIEKVFGETAYSFGDQNYKIKFYRKGNANIYGKMFFIGTDGFTIRLNKEEGSENQFDSISIWNKWKPTIVNNDLNFSVRPEGEIATTSLDLKQALELAQRVYKNKEPKTIDLQKLKVQKNGKDAKKEFEDEVQNSGETIINYTKLLDIADKKGYTIEEPEDKNLEVSVETPMEVPKQEQWIAHSFEKKMFEDDQKMIEDGELVINAINIQSLVSSKLAAENLLNFFDNLNRQGLIDNLSIDSVVFAAKVVDSKHPNWLKILTPKLK